MDNQKTDKRSWLESLVRYASGNSLKGLLVYLQVNIEDLSTSLVKTFRLGRVISAQGLKSIWLIAAAFLLALLYNAKKLLRGLRTVMINILKVAEIALISYTSEINPFWSRCAGLAKEVVLSQSELNSMTQDYIEHLSNLVLAIQEKGRGRPKKRELLALTRTAIQKISLFFASILWAAFMSVIYLCIFALPVYLFLRKRQFLTEDHRVESASDDSMINSGERGSPGDYIEIESLLNPLHQKGVRTTGDALIMQRGVLQSYEKVNKDTLLLRESQILILRHEWQYVGDRPVKGTFYYFMCIRDLGDSYSRSISKPFESIQSATKLCESIFKRVTWASKQN